MDCKLIAVGALDEKTGMRTVCFEVNGWFRTVDVQDTSAKVKVITNEKANPANPGHIGATMNSTLIDVKLKEGDEVKKGDAVAILSAMKMEMAIKSAVAGTVKRVVLKKGTNVESGDLIVEVEVKAE